jgi:hypothetical protein
MFIISFPHIHTAVAKDSIHVRFVSVVIVVAVFVVVIVVAIVGLFAVTMLPSIVDLAKCSNRQREI